MSAKKKKKNWFIILKNKTHDQITYYHTLAGLDNKDYPMTQC